MRLVSDQSVPTDLLTSSGFPMYSIAGAKPRSVCVKVMLARKEKIFQKIIYVA